MVSAIRGTYGQLGTLLAGDFTGQNNFFFWVAAVAILGMAGYVPYLQTPMRALLALVILAFALKNGTGFFSNLQSALSGATPSAAPASDTVASEVPAAFPITVTGSGGTGIPGQVGAAAGAAKTVLSLGTGIAGLFGG